MSYRTIETSHRDVKELLAGSELTGTTVSGSMVAWTRTVESETTLSIGWTGGTFGLIDVRARMQLGEHESRIGMLEDRIEEAFLSQGRVERRIEAIESRVEGFEARLGERPEVVLVEEMTHNEAKKRVETYFETHEETDTEELMRSLRIELKLLVEILDELKREGKIRSIDNT